MIMMTNHKSIDRVIKDYYDKRRNYLLLLQKIINSKKKML